jgi:hypothetical protein
MDSAEEMQLVLRVALKLCKKELEDTKQFVSCGAGLGTNRNVELIRPKHTTATEVKKYKEYWERHLRDLAARQECRVLAWWVNSMVITDASSECTVFIHIEHVEGKTTEIYVPYSADSSARVEYGKTFEGHAPERYLFT